jgi:hypothetical protein
MAARRRSDAASSPAISTCAAARRPVSIRFAIILHPAAITGVRGPTPASAPGGATWRPHAVPSQAALVDRARRAGVLRQPARQRGRIRPRGAPAPAR